MVSSFVSRACAVFALSTCIVALGACTEVEYVVDRAQQGANDAYDSVFSSKKPPKTSPTKVEVSVPAAAPYEDVKTKEIDAKPATGGAAEPVVLGSMRDMELMPKEPITPTAPMETKPAAAAEPAPLTTATTSAAQVDAANTVKQATAPVTIANENLGAPLLVVRFNQQHVYYDDALARAVGAAERAKSGMQYQVVSRLPDLSALPADQQENITNRATDNLRNVVTQMQLLGVSPERIKIANQKQDVRSQEIAVFVN